MIVHPEVWRALARARSDDLLREAAQQRQLTQIRTAAGRRWRDRLGRVLRRAQRLGDRRRPDTSAIAVIFSEPAAEPASAGIGHRR